jgi:membrane fusion protein, multidrug efflux system
MTRSKSAAVAAIAILAFSLASCGGRSTDAEQTEQDNSVLISPENLQVVDSANIASGPTISGSLQPDRAASIRAEIGGSVLETFAEAGQHVSRGTSLLRIDDTAIRDAWLSARSAVTSADQAATVAQRNLERSQRLADAGAIAESALENARIAASNAESQLADAKARLAQAEKQLAATQVKAPFAGIVGMRSVSAGDVVTPGTELYTVVDPTSMRLEAAVPASQLGRVRLGAPVEFTVTGYPGRRFTGHVDRISPTVDPSTGQVTINATVPNSKGDLVGGVFAQGRIGTDAKVALAVPTSAVTFSGPSASLLRIRNGVVERTDVQTGIRDEQAEMIEITAGLARGDTILTGAAQGFTPGTPVRVQVDRPVGP